MSSVVKSEHDSDVAHPGSGSVSSDHNDALAYIVKDITRETYIVGASIGYVDKTSCGITDPRWGVKWGAGYESEDASSPSIDVCNCIVFSTSRGEEEAEG